MFQFIHAADIHLDSPLRGLTSFDDAPVDQIRTATRRAFENLVDLAIRESVAFVVIAGDLWDGDWPDAGPGLFFIKQAKRLRQEGIPVYVVKGNHDAENTLTRELRYPDNVHLFGHLRPETVRLNPLNVAIHGQSFREANITSDLAAVYPPPVPGAFNIGLLHTCLDGDSRHYAYAPASVDALAAKHYQYWALGHVHQRRALERSGVPIVFPGNLQGRYIPETGPKGCELVTVGRAKHASPSRRAPPTRSRKPVLLSEWAVARTPFPGPWLGRARRRLHRDLFRLANEESMWNGQHERLLHGVVR